MKNNHLRCNWNLEGAKRSTNRATKSKEKRYKKFGFVPISRDRKCHRYAQRRIACGGGCPCNKCNITQLRLSCRPQGVEELPSCNQCTRANGKECDRRRLCKGCINKKRPASLTLKTAFCPEHIRPQIHYLRWFFSCWTFGGRGTI